MNRSRHAVPQATAIIEKPSITVMLVPPIATWQVAIATRSLTSSQARVSVCLEHIR